MQFGCPAVVVVLTNSRKVSVWARKPSVFPAGSGSYRPVVCGPDEVPRVLRVAEARRAPYTAAISAIVHGLDSDVARAAAIARVALRGARATLNEAALKEYYFTINAALSARAREVFAMFDKNPGFKRRLQKFNEEYSRTVGRAEGIAESVLTVLAARKVAVSKQQRKAILEARNRALLNRWFKLAVTTPDADALFSN